MRFTGIEFRRGDGTRFDFLTALLHTAIYTVCFSVVVLQAISCVTILVTRYRPEPARHRPAHHGDQPAGRLTAAGARSPRPENPVARRRAAVVTLAARGKTSGAACATACRSRTSSTSRRRSPARISRQGRAQAVHGAAGRRRGPPERRAVAPGLPPLAERALPARPAPAARPAFRRASWSRDFAPTRGQRRVLRRNAHLERVARSPWATEAQYALFRRYLDARHATGGMADMDMHEFAAMIEETPVRSRVIEYYRPAPGGRGAAARGGLPDRPALGRRVDGLLVLRPRPRRATASAATSSSTMSRSRARRRCLTSISATGCPAAPRWTTRRASSRSRSSPRAAGACSATPTPARLARRRGDRPAISEQVAAIELPVTK